jgi:hypothetical protein
VRGHVSACATECARQHARARWLPRLVWVLAATGASRRGTRQSPGRRHGWRRARHLRSAHESACGFSQWQGAFAAAKETVPLPSSIAIMCTRHTPTARPRWCGRPKRGGESYAREKGIKIQSWPRGRHARMLGCTMARGRWVRVATRANANVAANGTARRRGRERQGTANNGDKERLD